MDFVSNLAKKVQSKPAASDEQPNIPDQDKPSSNTDLFSSAKTVAGAAQSQFRSEDYNKAEAAGAGADLLNAASEYGKLDETQGIGKYVDQAEGYLRNYNTTDPAAAGDPVGETKTGSKLADSDDPAPVKTLGVDGDSDVLKSASADAPAGDGVSDLKSAASAAVGDSDDVKKTITDSVSDVKTAIPTGDAVSTGGDEPSAGGVGDYIKKADGFLSKPSSGDGEEEKAGDYLKEEAEDALKKPAGETAGDYLKEAEGIFSKQSGEAEEKTETGSEAQSGGGFGSALKVAGGFLNK